MTVGNWNSIIRTLAVVAGSATFCAVNGYAQSGAAVFSPNYHVGFERPEAWGLKYFASTTLLSGLTPPEASEDHHVGSISLGLEMGWMPELDEGQRRIGFYGRAVQDLNKAPVMMRPVIRVGLPGKFSALVAAPPPFRVWGVQSRLVAFGLERPLLERSAFTLGWRGYGQLGHVKGAFTCTRDAATFDPGSPENPTRCIAESADEASLRYAGMEFQGSYRVRPKWVPHVAVGGNFIDGVFQTNALVESGLDRTRLWTRGGTFSTSGGVSYLVTKRATFTVDAFYTPLWVQRTRTAARTNDGLFNVRALVNYTFR